MFIEKDHTDDNSNPEDNFSFNFLKESSAQICKSLGLAADTPFMEMTRRLRQELNLPIYASHEEIVKAIQQDLNKQTN